MLLPIPLIVYFHAPAIRETRALQWVYIRICMKCVGGEAINHCYYIGAIKRFATLD